MKLLVIEQAPSAALIIIMHATTIFISAALPRAPNAAFLYARHANAWSAIPLLTIERQSGQAGSPPMAAARRYDI